MSKQEEFVKIRFDVDETGWAVKLPNGNYRIANIPLAERLNIDDEVSLGEPVHGFQTVKEVIKSRFNSKGAVHYSVDDLPTFDKFVKDAEKSGNYKIEGMVPGIAFVAFSDDDYDDLKVLCALYGCKLVCEENEIMAS